MTNNPLSAPAGGSRNDVRFPDTLNAVKLARHLLANGLPVLRYREGNDTEGGEVVVTESVHVQVQAFGGPPAVVCDLPDERMQFYPKRPTLHALLADLRDAMKPEPTHGQ